MIGITRMLGPSVYFPPPVEKSTNVLLSETRYLEALTHSSRNHGVAGAEKGSPDGREVASSSAAAAADLVLPRSINSDGVSRRAESKGESTFFFSARREGERLRGGRGRYYSSTAERSSPRRVWLVTCSGSEFRGRRPGVFPEKKNAADRKKTQPALHGCKPGPPG